MTDLSTAYHETGHAIAALMRGGTVKSVTLDPGRAVVTRLDDDDGFIAFSGSWAQARAIWPLPSLDGQDSRGRTFADYLAVYVAKNVDDAAKFVDANTEGWSESLERNWAVIDSKAREIYRKYSVHIRTEREHRQRTLTRRTSRYRYQALQRQRLQREQKQLGLI